MTLENDEPPEITVWDAEGRPPTIAEWARHIAASAPPLSTTQRTQLATIFAGQSTRAAGPASLPADAA